MTKQRQGIFHQHNKSIPRRKDYRGARRNIENEAQRIDCCDTIIAGRDAVGAGATLNVTTITRRNDVLLYAYLFADTEKTVAYSVVESAAAPAGRDVHYRFIKTTTLDQVTLQVQNGLEAVTVDWKIRKCY